MNKMICAFFLLMGGCTTDIKHVQYHPTSQLATQQEARSVVLGKFADSRGVDPRLLCVVKNSFGAVLKRVEADRSVSDVVRDSFSQALAARNIEENGTSNVSIEGTVQNLGCVYLMSKAFSADIQITVLALPSRTVVFQQTYSTHREEFGAGAGVLADTDALMRLEEQTINQTIDKVFDDPAFLASFNVGTNARDMRPEPSQSAFSINERLKKLDELHAQGLISDDEYAMKRKELLDSL